MNSAVLSLTAQKSVIPARILLIEDDREVSNSIAEILSKKGYHTVQSYNGREGLVTAINQQFHLILLDKMLPELDGLELLHRLRKYRDTPVVMLSACGAEQDRIDGFSSGADDYLPKPFNMTELLFRIEALLRRSMSSAKSETCMGQIKDGTICLDTKNKCLASSDGDIELTPIEYELLKTFLTHKDEVLSKPYLYQLILSKPFSRYDRSLDMHISNLRSKMAPLVETHKIKTIRGQGYCYQ
ncbi:response regulator transcription factor [Neptuniibacter caesariensis]|uniref:DNA-binding response regulator n=1 Tax=Neptuniibacter caesariensis TaxID=207954 RepID=A0A7U8C273_NEPCE|nr:response regulator transcription factor [Neptuniibacter caesariensis]EAR59506.1 DNA-binding response regulator [Oceanospirillum sp. MED92] [Neptuniibacter caesariensis]